MIKDLRVFPVISNYLRFTCSADTLALSLPVGQPPVSFHLDSGLAGILTFSFPVL